MLLEALLQELLDALVSLCRADFLELCAQLAQLQQALPHMATQLLHDVSVWEGLLEVDQGPRSLQLLVNLWASVVDLDFDFIHTALLGLCSSLGEELLGASPEWALCLLEQAGSWLADVQPGLLFRRLRDLERQGVLLGLPPPSHHLEALAAIYTDPSLGPSHQAAANSLEHLSLLADVLLAMSQPDVLHPLHSLQGILDAIQNPECWDIVESQVYS